MPNKKKNKWKRKRFVGYGRRKNGHRGVLLLNVLPVVSTTTREIHWDTRGEIHDHGSRATRHASHATRSTMQVWLLWRVNTTASGRRGLGLHAKTDADTEWMTSLDTASDAAIWERADHTLQHKLSIKSWQHWSVAIRLKLVKLNNNPYTSHLTYWLNYSSSSKLLQGIQQLAYS